MATPVQVARLEAGAKGGTAGVKSFDDAQAQVGSARQAAVSAMNSEAGKISAPSALTGQLDRLISAPAATATAGLAAQGQAAATTNAADESGTNLYMREASAAIPVINAYANRDLGQKLAALAAQRSSTAGKVTDEQIRDQFLGQAEAARQQRETGATDRYQSDLQRLAQTDMQRRKDSAAVLADPSAGTTGSNQSSAQRARSLGTPSPGAFGGNVFGALQPTQELATPQAAMANETQGQQAAFDQQRNKRMAALAQLQNQLAGPGIAQEATALGEQAGVDPYRLRGIFTPSVDSQYVNAQKALGNYKDPNATSVRDIMLPDEQAAQLAGRIGVPGVTGPLSPELVKQITTSQFYDWQSNKTLNGKFATWVKAPANAKVVRENTDKSTGVQNLDALHTAFENDPQAASLKTSFVDDIAASAQSAITHHVPFADFVRSALNYPAYAGHGRTLAFMFAKVKPMFDAALVNDTRTAQPGGYNDPTAYAGP